MTKVNNFPPRKNVVHTKIEQSEVYSPNKAQLHIKSELSVFIKLSPSMWSIIPLRFKTDLQINASKLRKHNEVLI